MTEYNKGDIVNFLLELYNPVKRQYFNQIRTGVIVDKQLYKKPYKSEGINVYTINLCSRSNPGRTFSVPETYIISLHKK